MTTADTYVRARIDDITKKLAAKNLEAVGLTLSDFIRINLKRAAVDAGFVVNLETPNAVTRAAMAELDAGKGKKFATVEALMADLNADD